MSRCRSTRVRTWYRQNMRLLLVVVILLSLWCEGVEDSKGVQAVKDHYENLPYPRLHVRQ